MDHLQAEAVRVVDEMTAAGAAFTYRPAKDGIGASFTYELSAGGNRKRCRELIAEAKWRAAVWPLVVAEIGRRSEVAPHG